MRQTAAWMVFSGLLALGGMGLSNAQDQSTAGGTESVEADTSSAPAGVPQTVCPVMGGAINKDVYTDCDGKRVYFCCPACIEKFAKDPAGYIEKLESQGITPEQVPQPQTHCPVTGREIDKEFYVDHGGLRIYACCASCVGTIAADPDFYIKVLEKQGVTIDRVQGEATHETSDSGQSASGASHSEDAQGHKSDK